MIGPEAPLAAGVADALRAAGIAVFGPTRGGGADRDVEGVLPRGRRGGRGARWPGRGPSAAARERRRGVRRELAAAAARVVLKADGLAAGKGVIVYATRSSRRCELVAVVPRRRPRPRAGPGHRGAPRGPRGERHRDLRRRDAPSPCPPRATTSGCATATTGRTPAAWAPTRRCRTSTTRRSSAIARDGPPADPRRARPPRHAVPRLPVRGPDAHRRRARCSSSATSGSATPRRR